MGTQKEKLLKEEISIFWKSIIKTGECWIWNGTYNHGYGVLRYKGRVNIAHRLSYIINVGDIAEEYIIHHICCNTFCVRPSHLEAILVKEHGKYLRGGSRWRKKYHNSDRICDLICGMSSRYDYCVWNFLFFPDSCPKKSEFYKINL